MRPKNFLWRHSVRILFLASLAFFAFAEVKVMARIVCVKDQRANLRRGPSLSYPITWEVFRYMPLEVLAKKDGWYRIKDVDQEIHWIREDLVSSDMNCATIKGEFANLRKGPGVTFPASVAPKGDRYLSFRVIGQRAGWARLEDAEGDISWVRKDLLWMN